ncbi:hypothetical protein TWF696_000521 [Orbilia brochopaga]|uniref:Uncharacterized protein n=1 Tax=Orbilia brochopaga TaxID=3140254 RepID=A0AAV9VBK8_9PEZI
MESLTNSNRAVIHQTVSDVDVAQKTRAPALLNSIEANSFVADSIQKFLGSGSDPEADLLSFRETLSILHDALLDVTLEELRNRTVFQHHPRLARVVATCEKDLVDLRQKIAALTSSERLAKRVCSWTKFKWMFMEGNSRSYEERFKFHADIINFHCGKIIASQSASSQETEKTAECATEDNLSFRNKDTRHKRRKFKGSLDSQKVPSSITITPKTPKPTTVHQLSASVGIDSNNAKEALDSIESRLEMPAKPPPQPTEPQQGRKVDIRLGSEHAVEPEIKFQYIETIVFREVGSKPESSRPPPSKPILEHFNNYTERKLSGRMLKFLSKAIVGAEIIPMRRRGIPRIIRGIGDSVAH